MQNKYRLSSSVFVRETEEEKEKPLKIIFLSVEGNKTEVEYFKELSKHRVALGISAKIDVEVLQRRSTDTNSAPSAVAELLDEFKELRKFGLGEESLVKEIIKITSNQYSAADVRSFINESGELAETKKEKIYDALQKDNYDFIYRKYLINRSSENDEFGIVIDSDRQAHKKKNLIFCIQYCEQHNYDCYISNPCFEFWLLLHLTDVKITYSDRMEIILENKKDSNRHTFVSGEVSRLAKHGKSNIRFENNYLNTINKAIERAQGFESDNFKLIENIGTNIWQLIVKLRSADITL